ncbi:glutathione S-transferase domain-containing protein, partial [Klebsiella aerogenes]|uniref:glutathione S-transferase domain-containing protein n=1 Tax=Klebsiella aerogenes TaxID=548 RepID=UPI0034D58E70
LMHWFNVKFFEEVSGPLVAERIDKRFMAPEHGGGAPDTNALRAARANIRYHIRYIGWLAARNDWLAGPELSYADLVVVPRHIAQIVDDRQVG